MDSSALLLTGIGLAAAAGLNAYIPLLLCGLLARFDVLDLAAPYDLLASNTALAVLTVLLAIEVLADKIPAVDSLNDVVQTVLRPASGALLFAAAASGNAQWVQVLALVAGLVTAGTVHGAKAVARPMINVSTAGTGGPVVSVVEDAVSITLTLAAIFLPVLVLALLGVLGYLGWRVVRRRRQRAPGVTGSAG
jgi:hypothetical protein